MHSNNTSDSNIILRPNLTGVAGLIRLRIGIGPLHTGYSTSGSPNPAQM